MHTGYIVGIIVAAVLAVATSVIAYLFFVKTNAATVRVSELQKQSLVLSEQANALQQTLEQAPKAVPSYYTTPAIRPYVTPTSILAEDMRTGSKTTVATLPEGQHYDMYAQPQRGFDGRIFLRRVMLDSDIPRLLLAEFNVESGTELTPIPFLEQLPFIASAVALSPNQRYLAAAYDNPNDPSSSADAVSRRFVFWDLVSGKADERTANADYGFASNYGDFGGAGDFEVFWMNHQCAEVKTYRIAKDASGKEIFPRDTLGYTIFCLPE